jgi:hypothetical protein
MRLTLAIAVLALAACGGAAQGQPDAAACAAEEPTAAGVQERVFRPSCGLSNSCHAAGGQQAGLDLSSVEASCRSLKGKSSCELPAKSRAAFLVEKLSCPSEKCEGEPAAACAATSNQRMPLGSPPLKACDLALVARWVEQGLPGCP